MTEVRYHTPTGRWVLLATVLGSGLVTLDATVVNVALPAIGAELDADFASLQWTVNAYTLAQAGLLLLGGALGDRHGHRRVFVLGLLWFAGASVLCGAAPSASWLIAARALQGVGAALLTPASLAIIESTIHPDDRSAAIGAWSGLGGVMTAIGPLVGGYLTAAVTWRLIFLINLPFTGLAVWAAVRHVPERRETRRAARHPLLPLALFRSRQFTGANVVTFVIYGALAGALFLLPIQLQRVLSFSALESGMALIPMTVLMLILSPSSGRLAARVGPRLPMVVGPLIAAVGLALLVRVAPGSSYMATTLPAVIVLGLGLSITVAPLTWTVLSAAEPEHAGVAAAINTVVARAAAAIAVATLPAGAGIAGRAALEPDVFATGFPRAMWMAATLAAAGGVLSYGTIRSEPVGAETSRERPPAVRRLSCPLDAPPPPVSGR